MCDDHGEKVANANNSSQRAYLGTKLKRICKHKERMERGMGCRCLIEACYAMDQDHGCHAVRTGLRESGGAVEGSPYDPTCPLNVRRPPLATPPRWKEGRCEPDETMPPCSLVLLPNLGATGAFGFGLNSNSPLRKAWLDSGKTREQGGLCGCRSGSEE